MTNPLLTPPAPTPEQKLLSDISVAGWSIIQNVRDPWITMWNLIWRNQDGLTPQQAWAALDTRALRLLQDSRLLNDFVNAQVGPDDPRYIHHGIPDGSEFFVKLGITSSFTLQAEVVEQLPTGRILVTEIEA